MDDRTLALLGDPAAQERITERGELLPCPFCGNKNIRTSNWGMWRCWCPECFGKSEDTLWERDAVKHWNTRAPTRVKKDYAMPGALEFEGRIDIVRED